ncbi:MAG: hypothetical protein ACR2F2_09295 [Pyrinomonadaceae bacterium]
MVNLSTDKAVLAELQKKADELRKAIGTTGDEKFDAAMKNAKPLDAKSVCIKRVKESEKIIVIGLKESGDDSCSFHGAFVDSRFYYSDEKTLSKNVLDALGWQKAERTQREKLAKLWVEKGLLAFYTVLYTKDVDFLKDFQSKSEVTYKGGQPPKQPEFHPPQVVSNESGETIVNLWTSVMKTKKEFERHEFRFAADANLLND